MKSYIIKIEIEESNPLIWRKVVMPAGATYRRLHDVIQNATNFQSGYPHTGYHLYEFDLSKEGLLVTDDEDTYIEQAKCKVRKPSGLKIDSYLEKYGEILYYYDFGDDWRLKIKLEDVVEDYYFGYPTLIDGAETAPPEDVGGIWGYYEFLEIYRNFDHPKHRDIKKWADSQYFREYDPIWINARLRGIEYKKTQWDQINHKQYIVIEDKYRK